MFGRGFACDSSCSAYCHLIFFALNFVFLCFFSFGFAWTLTYSFSYIYFIFLFSFTFYNRLFFLDFFPFLKKNAIFQVQVLQLNFLIIVFTFFLVYLFLTIAFSILWSGAMMIGAILWTYLLCWICFPDAAFYTKFIRNGTACWMASG